MKRILPALNYNNDLGFQIGGLGQLFYYGDGSLYPQYLHKLEAHAFFIPKVPSRPSSITTPSTSSPACG